MKKIYFTIGLSLWMFAGQAQIDRSKMPEPGPSPEINLKEPRSFELKNGLKVMVVENSKLPRVSMQLLIDNPPLAEGKIAGVSSLTASLLGNGSKSIPKDDYNEEVDFLGARISFGAQSAFANSLSKYFPRILELMADAAINPNFTQEEFEKEKAKLITSLKAQENDVSAIANRVQNALAYGKKHPYGEFATEETVNTVTLADVIWFYDNYFVPANAYLVVIGDIKFDEVKELVTENFTPWTRAVPPGLQYSRPSDALFTQINFVDMPNAVQSEVSVQNLVDLQMKDTDYLDALLANRILGGGAQARLFLNLREDKAYTYGSYSSLGNDKYAPALFSASASVRNAVTDSATVEMMKEVDKIIREPVTDEELKNAKAEYVGNFVMALERPETIARYALNIETEDLPGDFYKTYLERLNAVSKEGVQKAAQKYFTAGNTRVVVVGNGNEVLENLEKVTFDGKPVPVRYYSKTGEKVDKPDYKEAIPEGVTAESVLEKYIEAIGGKEKLQAVESYSLLAEAEMQGMKLELDVKKTSKDQFMQDVRVMGNSMSKQVLDGESGYMVMQGQRKDMTLEELRKVKEESAPFPELSYLNAGVSIEGIEVVGDKKAYRIKITESKSSFYDIETGLKLQEVNALEMEGQNMKQTLKFEDYQQVSGIKFPFKMFQNMGPQNIEFVVKEIKVNEGVSDLDFD
ncbi:MAG TPA: pitrilysin family protein [Eudoraea sp.]|nr:pitrilysin family protein [Eudoraea sp.]